MFFHYVIFRILLIIGQSEIYDKFLPKNKAVGTYEAESKNKGSIIYKGPHGGLYFYNKYEEGETPNPNYIRKEFKKHIKYFSLND